ncbi:hypothetical protein KIW84_065995 [Lathyrus oleraceus]|uniref:DUF7745 domain-containing protein n=1 Tax=Pisum sativum TaxID=3888 RepID=A0A9D4WEG4_PEA|nr:hypothetical protein KIW84_065995 [Pisum sativum]
MIGYRHTVEEMTYHLNIHGTDLQTNPRACWDFKGFPREYLDKKVVDVTTSLQRDALDNIMILPTFKLVLLPTKKGFMDYTTINLFLAVKVGDKDHVPALLADVQYTLYQRHTKKGEKTRNRTTIQKVIHAWGKLNKGILKIPKEEFIIPYAQWMRERARIIKLPFVLEGPVEPRAHVPIMIYVDEGNNLNTSILQLKGGVGRELLLDYEIWIKSTNTQKEAKEEYEVCIQALETEVQRVVNSLCEAKSQAMDSILQRRVVEGLLALRPSKWSNAYEEVVDLKRQMNLLEESYDKMRQLCTYVEGHNQAMADTIEDDKAIKLKLQEKAKYYRKNT